MTAGSEIRCGLVGYGAWGAHHARGIRETDGACVAAIAVPSAESRARAKAENPDAEIFDSHETMLQQVELDLVDVVIPSHLHHSVSLAVLESGCHLLLEKPMALTTQQCDDLITVARRKNLLVAVGHELRMSALWGKVKSLIDDGAIGDPLHCLIELWRRPYRPGASGWRYDINRVGNWVLEEPIHFFDLARWYFSAAGEPESVFAMANGRQPGHPELHDNFSAMVRFPQGSYAVINQTLAAWEHHQTVRVTGTTGALWARWSGAMDRTFHPTFSLQVQDGDAGRDVPIDSPTGEVYELVEEIRMMVHAVRDGTPIASDAVDGWWSVALCQAAQESLATGLPVVMKDRPA
jgi:myo-inositol 2-dehydrogenase/D-chiro-inositol 1-dehydrogenase